VDEKILGMAGIVALMFLSHTVHADNSEWCGTIMAIYGVCSPELIENYLSHTQGAYAETTSFVAEPAKPAEPEPQLLASSLEEQPLGFIEERPQAQEEPEQPCWYWAGYEWRVCRMVE